MTEKFELVEKAIGPVIEIEEHVPVWKMPTTFGRDFQRINDYLVSQGAECAGMPYARYQDMNWEVELNRSKLANFIAMFFKKWHFFAGLPSSKQLPGDSSLQSQDIVEQKYVTTIHKGPYQDVGPTYKALYAWAKTQGLTLKNEAIECYLNDPNEVEKADIETEILIPVAG